MNTQLLIGLIICHFLADYTHLSLPWMLSAKKFGTPAFPIFCHGLVHAVLMTIWMLICGTEIHFMLLAALFQLITHTLIDITKGRVNYLYPKVQNPINISYWYVFGLDQTFHFIVLILMVNICSI